MWYLKAWTPLSFTLLLLAGITVVALSAPPAVADPSAAQQASLRAAENALKGAEGDLQAAAGSAGTAANPAKGSRLKLTRMRLDSGIKRLNEAAGILSGLPGDDPGVQALLARHAAAAQIAQRVTAIISAGSGAPTGAGGGQQPAGSGMPPAPTDSGPRLDYRLEQKLKDARWYLREVEKYIGGAMEVVKRMDGEGEPVVHADVRAALNSVETAEAKFKLVEGYLAELPADHPQVQAVAAEAAKQKDTLGGLQSRLKAADAQLDKLTGMRHYPNYDEDFRKIQDFSRRYGNFPETVQQPEKLASIIREDAEVMKEVKRIARLYLPLVEQQTEAGAKMNKLFTYLIERRNGFAGEVKTYGAQLPAAIDADLAEATRIADQGVAEKRPIFFGPGSGIEQQMGFAEQKIMVLTALDPARGAAYRKKLSDARADTAKRAESLAGEIIVNNKLPPNRYQGGDRAELVKVATAGWQQEQPGAKVLGARIPSADWKRVTEWRFGNGSFYKVDYSWIQVQLLVDQDGKLAAIRSVNISKLHLEGDQLSASLLDSAEDQPRPQQLLMKDKIR